MPHGRSARGLPRHNPEQLALAVWAVIASRGVAAVSMRSVAAQAGVSVGLVQHYFTSKEGLLHASMQLMVDTAVGNQADGSDPITELRDVLSHVIPSTPQARTGTTVWYAFLALAAHDAAAAEILSRAKRGQQARAEQLLARLSVPDPAEAALGLIALADGLAARVLIDLDVHQAQDAVNRAIHEVTASVDAREPALWSRTRGVGSG